MRGVVVQVSRERLRLLVATYSKQLAEIGSLESRLTEASETSAGVDSRSGPARLFDPFAASAQLDRKLQEVTAENKTLRTKNAELANQLEEIQATVETLRNDKAAKTSRPLINTAGIPSTPFGIGPSPILSPSAVADLALASELSDIFSTGGRQPSS